MAKILERINDATGERELWIRCPGCATRRDDKYAALKNVSGHQFDGDFEAPTLEPSLGTSGANGFRCHSYVRGGMIQFLGDSTHPLKGQTVPLLDIGPADL